MSQKDKLNAVLFNAHLSPDKESEYLYSHEVRVVHEISMYDIELEAQQYGDNADIYINGALHVLNAMFGD